LLTLPVDRFSRLIAVFHIPVIWLSAFPAAQLSREGVPVGEAIWLNGAAKLYLPIHTQLLCLLKQIFINHRRIKFISKVFPVF